VQDGEVSATLEDLGLFFMEVLEQEVTVFVGKIRLRQTGGHNGYNGWH
jgi:peptidyl-tRNA hydrolase